MNAIRIMFLVMFVSLVIASFWSKIPLIKDSVHTILDPTTGKLIEWNVYIGMFVIVFFANLLTTIVQKYGTDQESLRKIKKEQKEIQEEMKKFKDNPSKLMELNKKQLENIPRTFELTLRPLLYTAIPFILLIRWFIDYFSGIEVKFFGFLSWFWFYLIFSIIFSSILRKVLNVA